VSVTTNATLTSTGYGVFNSTIDGEAGDDQITITGTRSTTSPNTVSLSGNAYGIYQSTVNGGSGNDIINASGTNFGIKDALISGRQGNDSFNVGTGQGTVDGGSGQDRLIIDYFQLDSTTQKPINITVNALGADVLIQGATDNLGNANTWTQTIRGIEQFLVNGTTYSAAQLVSRFG
jgi:Ca2+-binding RTX toxin-like protein